MNLAMNQYYESGCNSALEKYATQGKYTTSLAGGAAKRLLELLAGGKKITRAGMGKSVRSFRPGNHPSILLNWKGTGIPTDTLLSGLERGPLRNEALKSLGARAATGTAAIGGYKALSKKKSKKKK